MTPGDAGSADVDGGGRRPLRLAHRGDWRAAPENSLAALAAAMRVPGCDGVEFDVRISADGVPVVIHDETLGRVQRVAARADALTAAQLADLGVPALGTALAALPGAAFLDVELKGDDHGAPTADVLRAARGPAPGRAVISSFEPATLAAMRTHLPGWPRWLNADALDPETLAAAAGLGCAAVSVQWRAVDPDAVARARAAGLEVAAWTVRTARDAERFADMGVVAMCVEGDALGA